MKTIITDSIKNTNRIIRRENDNGLSTFGTEVITALGIAWQIVMESLSEKGITPARLINNATASAIVLKLVFEDESRLPFVPLESICLSTAREIYTNMNLLRCNKHKESSIDKDRVEYLEKFLVIYEEELKKRNLYDEPLVLKEAIELLKNGMVKYQCDEIMTCYYKEPSKLENDFVSLLGTSKEYPKPEGKEVSYRFVKTYGIVNEADYVAKTIIDSNISLGDVEIICDTAVYAPYIEEAFTKRNLTYTFSTGVSGAGFNVIVMIKDLIKWYSSGCNYKEFFRISHNPIYAIEVNGKQERATRAYLKGISFGIGWGKDRYLDVEPTDYDKSHPDSEDDNCKAFRTVELPKLYELADEIDMAKTSVEVLDALVNYSKSHSFKRNIDNRYTIRALDLLRKNLDATGIIFNKKEDMLEYIVNELDTISYTMSESSKMASVSSIYTPLCLDRKNVFVLGLSAKEFKISNADSPVLSDAIRKDIFEYPCGNVTLAEDNTVNAEQVVRDTLTSAPDYSYITLIASSADVMRDSSDVSASSLYDKLMKEICGPEDKETAYYDITTDDTNVDHNTLWNGFDITYDACPEELELSFSKSSLDTFLKCPLEYHYDKDLHINKEEYKDYDPSKWLEANTKGTLIHSILEKYAKKALLGKTTVNPIFDENSSDFISAKEEAVAEIEGMCAAPNVEIRNKEVEDCVAMVTDYLEFLHKELNDTGWVVYKCEEPMDSAISKIEFTHNGIKYIVSFTGIIDRIDCKTNDDGTCEYRIIDYKTGAKKSAGQMIEETKQHLIYADYVRKCFGGEVKSFDYLFISRIKDSNDWDASIDKDELKKPAIDLSNEEPRCELDLFDRVYNAHDYISLNNPKRDCGFCKYTDICLYKNI